jgi:hypothetical protein
MNIREDRKENKQKCYRKQFLKAFGNVYYYSISVYSLRFERQISFISFSLLGV